MALRRLAFQFLYQIDAASSPDPVALDTFLSPRSPMSRPWPMATEDVRTLVKGAMTTARMPTPSSSPSPRVAHQPPRPVDRALLRLATSK